MLRIEDELKNNQISRFQLLYGEERYMVQYYRNQLIEKLSNPDDEKNGRVIEVAQCNRGGYTSFLRDDAIPVPDGADVWFRTKVRKQTYTYEYSFDGENYKEIPVTLDASILSDDYVLQSYGGFFTGAFVGMACVDYAGYNTVAEFRSFDYKEYED